MALTKTIDKATFDALPDHFKAEYKAVGEKFMLDIVGDDGVDWKQKREIEAEHRKTAEARLKATQDELDNIRRGAIPKDDVAALEKSWGEKLTARETELTAKINELYGTIANTTVRSAATELAQMFLAPAAVMPMVSSRIKSEIVNGIATTRVLDKNGQPSALTLEDLKNEFKNDATLAPILVGSKASGGGAANGNNSGNAGAGGKKLSELTEAERVKLYRENKAEFDRLVAESK